MSDRFYQQQAKVDHAGRPLRIKWEQPTYYRLMQQNSKPIQAQVTITSRPKKHSPETILLAKCLKMLQCNK